MKETETKEQIIWLHVFKICELCKLSQTKSREVTPDWKRELGVLAGWIKYLFGGSSDGGCTEFSMQLVFHDNILKWKFLCYGYILQKM